MDMSTVALVLVLFLFVLVVGMQFHLRRLSRMMNELLERERNQAPPD